MVLPYCSAFVTTLAHVRQIDQLQIDHLHIVHLDPTSTLPLRYVVQDLYSTDTSHEACASWCRAYGAHPATWGKLLYANDESIY